MNSVAILMCFAVLGTQFGWQPTPEGELEYIIQIEPDLLESLRDGEEIVSRIHPDAKGVTRFRIKVGTGELPRTGLPEPIAAGRPVDLSPDTSTGALPPRRDAATEPVQDDAAKHEEPARRSLGTNDSAWQPPQLPNHAPLPPGQQDDQPWNVTAPQDDAVVDDPPPEIDATDEDSRSSAFNFGAGLPQDFGADDDDDNVPQSPTEPEFTPPDISFNPGSPEHDTYVPSEPEEGVPHTVVQRNDGQLQPIPHPDTAPLQPRSLEHSQTNEATPLVWNGEPPSRPATTAAKNPAPTTAETPTSRPWLLLVFTSLALFASLAANAYLVWILLSVYRRYQQMAQQLAHEPA